MAGGQPPRPVEAEHALRVESIRLPAEQTFASKDKADAWLRRPTAALDGRRPIDLLDCETGSQRVEQLHCLLKMLVRPDARRLDLSRGSGHAWSVGVRRETHR